MNLSPLGFYRYGSEFFEAGKSFKTKYRFSPVRYYLYSKSIELFLKAFLRSKGVTKKKLKSRDDLGHDLMKALKEARLLKIDDVVEITLEEEKEVSKANFYYLSKGFEYFEGFMITKAMEGYPDLPDLVVLENLASKLAEKLKQL